MNFSLAHRKMGIDKLLGLWYNHIAGESPHRKGLSFGVGDRMAVFVEE